ncbi:MAG: S8 family peptidase [Bacteroidetes bacterium]|nr:S8 family peptidase [Bacteroidota bacterium]MBS1741069.1 S8 family peptidase [Bacteroidota bacterium]
MLIRCRAWWVLLLGLISFQVSAKEEVVFCVTFKDKGTQSIESARLSLSTRSLARRDRQKIGLTFSDIPIFQPYVEEISSLCGVHLLYTSKWLNACIVSTPDSSIFEQLINTSFISSITPIGNISTQLSTQSNKAKITGNASYYGNAWTQTNLVRGDCLHDHGFRGQNMLIAVLDDGFYYVNSQPAFDSAFSNGRIVDTRNFVLGGTDVYSDFHTHGTEVFSTISANLPNTFVGAAPAAQFALYVTEDTQHEWPIEMYNMVAAMERADSIGADVISSSTGYNTFDAPYQNQNITAAQMDGKTTVAAIGVNTAAQKGILVVMTAGNEGSGGLLTPGDADSAITVGNVDASKIPAGNSGYGPNAAAIIKPDICALGQPGFVITTAQTPFGVSGTSIATPQVAGFAACLWQGLLSKTNSEIKQVILKTSSLYPTPQMPQLGYGIPNFCNAYLTEDIPQILTETTSLVFPNPFSTHLTLPISKGELLQASLYDATGKLTGTFLKKGATLELNTEALTSGIYFCKIQGSRGIQSIKLIKY